MDDQKVTVGMIAEEVKIAEDLAILLERQLYIHYVNGRWTAGFAKDGAETHLQGKRLGTLNEALLDSIRYGVRLAAVKMDELENSK